MVKERKKSTSGLDLGRAQGERRPRPAVTVFLSDGLSCASRAVTRGSSGASADFAAFFASRAQRGGANMLVLSLTFLGSGDWAPGSTGLKAFFVIRARGWSTASDLRLQDLDVH